MPGKSSTMDRRCPAIRLKRVDFPTLGRPTRATIGVDIHLLVLNPISEDYLADYTPAINTVSANTRMVAGRFSFA